MRNGMTLPQHQRGLTMISWVIIIALASLLVVMGLKLFPVYMEHFSVSSSLKSLSTDDGLRGVSPGELRTALEKRLQINDVKSVDKDAITVARNGGVYEVNVAYEVQIPFVYNIDFLVSFDDTAEVAAR